MRNIEEEFSELTNHYNRNELIDKVQKQLDKMEHKRKELENAILLFQAACMDAGFKIAQIQYRLKNDKDEFGQERWYKWDSHSKKQ